MNFLIELILLLMLIQLFYRERKLNEQLKVKNQRENKKSVVIDISDEEVTPALIQKITSYNLNLKKKLLVLVETENEQEIRDIIDQIKANGEFIIHLFEYDDSIRHHINPECEQESNQFNENQRIKEEVISDLKGFRPRQGRMYDEVIFKIY